VEATDSGLTVVIVRGPVAPGGHVRRAGEEIARGDLAVPAGTQLTDVHIGLLAALGRRTVLVTPPPRVLIVTAGDELVMPGAAIAHGQVFAANGVMLAAAVRAAGASAVLIDPLPDDPVTLRREIERHTTAVDIVLTAGGISAGAHEVVKEALAGRGVEFVKVAIRPGMPQGAGRYAGLPLIALPGNPVSAWTSFEVFVRPVLRQAMRHQHPHRSIKTMAVGQVVTSSAAHRHFVPAVHDPVALTVSPVTGSVSHSLRRLSEATCLLDIDEGTAELRPGQSVPAWLLG
jgi:molybdopterin molybdotransferase